jgi:pyruvate dehydrogenase E2 component (dihydrolipoamide acetyltransferase)
MPALSPTMKEGKLARWHKKEGDQVSSGEVIAEIETDKATMEFEAADEGTLGKIIVPEGSENVEVNSPIAVLLEEGESKEDIDNAGIQKKKGPSPETQSVSTSPEGEVKSPSPRGEGRGEGKKDSPQQERIFASPLARRLAEEKGIDLSQINGSGPRGRIIKADIEKSEPGQKAAMPAASSAAAMPTGKRDEAKQLADALGMEYEEIPNSNVRKVIASRLLESKQTIPHFYLTLECAIDDLLKARKHINDEAKGEYKMSVNDIIIKALAQALKAYPKANVGWTDDAILQFKHADISVAVATPDGLVTPIIRKAETKGLKEISSEIKDLATRAREGKLRAEEFQGGTITLSNLGMYGIKEFQAIINPPQSCILSVGAGEQRPYVDGGEVKIGTFMNCTLSCDHRSVDGATGAEFLNVFKGYIENPASMLV